MEPYNPPQDPLHILYQDEHIMVVNKPSGLLSVPGRAPENKDSLMTRIQADHPAAESVHRLDYRIRQHPRHPARGVQLHHRPRQLAGTRL